jgi:colanic acid biosynthesis glycosyl transferase WcaI
MQVIFVNRYFAPDESATSQILSDLAFELGRAGWAVHIVTSRQLYEAPQVRLDPLERRDGVTVHRVWTSRFGRSSLPGRALDYLTFHLGAAWALLKLARRGDIVVAKTDPPLISVVVGAVAWLRGARLVNWLQDVFPEVALSLAPGRLVRTMAGLLTGLRNASLRGATLNVTLGRRMAQHVRAQGVAADRVAVIGNWADGETLTPLAPADNPLRQAWGLDGHFVVGYSGNMGRAHEFDTILAAAEHLRAEPAVVFLLIGGGYYKAWIEEQVRSRGLKNVLVKPYQAREALRQSLAVPDVHLVCLRPELEGLIVPSKVYGIAAVGRPMLFIGDAQGEVAEMLARDCCGATVGIGEADRLAGAIRRLHASPALRAEQGLNARKALMARYDRPIALAAWKGALAGVAEQSTRPQPLPLGRRAVSGPPPG